MRHCVFCGGRANSKEHAWPEWLLKLERPGRRVEWLRGLDAEEVLYIPNGELRTGVVCKRCNNGWMDRIEQSSRHVITAMHQNLSIPLDEELQRIVALWTVKTTMVMEAFGKKDAPWFYEPVQRHAMREAHQIPERTGVWVGRYLGLHTPAWFAGPFGPTPEMTLGLSVTMTFGALSVHLVTLRADYNVPKVEGPWTDALARVWPTTPGLIHWPPSVSFSDDGGGHVPLRRLVRRVLGDG